MLVFAACVVLYVAGFATVQWWRNRRGPWEVKFRVEPQGTPTVEITQHRLGIAGVTLRFTATNLPPNPSGTLVRFDGPAQRDKLPFGRVEFLDTTFLPGTVTMDLFGHQVELLPRVLTVDKVERAWRNAQTIELANPQPAIPTNPKAAGPGLSGGSDGRR